MSGVGPTSATEAVLNPGASPSPTPTASADPLQPEDIAESVYWAASLPPHVNINAIEIMPVSQSWAPFQVHRKQVS